MTDAGFFHFIAQADPIAWGVLLALLLMSVVSWSLTLAKVYQALTAAGRRRNFLDAYRACATPLDLDSHLNHGAAIDAKTDAMSRLAAAGFAACLRWNRRSGEVLLVETEAGIDDMLDRALYRAAAAERARGESGLTALAAVASTAPFVGLFGTVWGIYHALLAIGISGQASLDKVAGPVGEALSMTAIGVAVAIPAALAYNAAVRANRVAMVELEDFAHDFHAFLVTGVHDPRTQTARPAKRFLTPAEAV